MSKSVYPERIIPHETPAGPLAAHLVRYDFALEHCSGKKVLDAACGVGYGSHYLARVAAEVVAVDISDEAIRYAEEHYAGQNVTFQVMDVQRLDFPDRSFDVVCSFETIEHLDDPSGFLAGVARVLRPEGCLIVSTPHVRKTDRNPKNPFHRIELSYADFSHLLGQYFQNVRILGQRRNQSSLHYYLQRIDFLRLRTRVPIAARRGLARVVQTPPWEETGLEGFTIAPTGLRRASELVAVCSGPRGS